MSLISQLGRRGMRRGPLLSLIDIAHKGTGFEEIQSNEAPLTYTVDNRTLSSPNSYVLLITTGNDNLAVVTTRFHGLNIKTTLMASC